MNLDSTLSKKNTAVIDNDFMMDDFDFKPITSGLGFNHKPVDGRPVFTDRTICAPVLTPAAMTSRKEMSVYSNDLSLFYGLPNSHSRPETISAQEEKTENFHRLATRPQRIFAYLTDVLLVASIVGLLLTLMARSIEMDIIDAWTAFPHEITPLVVTLFTGFYFIYFSIFEKSSSSTLGKSLFSLKVVNLANGQLGLMTLVCRSFITLLNFFTLGLFSYFDLQNKVTHSKVIRND